MERYNVGDWVRIIPRSSRPKAFKEKWGGRNAKVMKVRTVPYKIDSAYKVRVHWEHTRWFDGDEVERLDDSPATKAKRWEATKLRIMRG